MSRGQGKAAGNGHLYQRRFAVLRKKFLSF